MQEWSVGIAIAHQLGERRAFALMERLLPMLEPYAAAGGSGAATLDVRMAVAADSVETAVAKALRAFTNALRRGGGPRSPKIVWMEAQTVERLDAELERPNVPELVGIKEIADLLGISRQLASYLAHGRDFPVPLARLATGPVWDKQSLTWWIENWQQRRRKPRRPRKVRAKPSVA